MDFELVKSFLEKSSSGVSSEDIDSMPFRFFEPMIMSGLKVDLIERGRVLCSMKVPPRLLVSLGIFHSIDSTKWTIFVTLRNYFGENQTPFSCFVFSEIEDSVTNFLFRNHGLKNVGNSLHGGATAALVDVVGSSVIMTMDSVTTTGVSVEINVSYLDAAFVGVRISFICS